MVPAYEVPHATRFNDVLSEGAKRAFRLVDFAPDDIAPDDIAFLQ